MVISRACQEAPASPDAGPGSFNGASDKEAAEALVSADRPSTVPVAGSCLTRTLGMLEHWELKVGTISTGELQLIVR
ncbi:hypothetical protein NDU88_004892 [Pleurodeles waltl]|uniref:Uncharacterized protein n=1 Tax=Pleurodeles waltl TaxID=8319 RepID=A0AAV7WXZ3_PLEWA|nr:hypothetical protein NDU88_004892 [Pleurodeles waltl]